MNVVPPHPPSVRSQGARHPAILTTTFAHAATLGLSISSNAHVFITEAANGYGAYSPRKYTLLSALVAELVLTAGFIFVILGATSRRASAGFAAIPIGFALTLIHLISIPVTNTSVNPARSTGPALFVGGWALEQLWLFWVAPIVGAILGAVAYRLVSDLALERASHAQSATRA